MSTITTRDRLLDEAEQLFAQKGYDGVSIREIASAAEVNVAAINYHFQGKQNLYRLVLERHILPKRTRLIQALDHQVAGAHDEHSLETLIRSFVSIHLDDALRRPGGAMGMRLVSREMSDPGHGAIVVMEGLIRPVRSRMRALLQELLPELAARDLHLLMGSVMGQILYFAMHWHNMILATKQDQSSEVIPAGLADDLETYIMTVIAHVTRFALGGVAAMQKEAGA